MTPTGLAPRDHRATPGFIALASVALALGIGLNVLIFSFTSPVLIKGLPYPEPDRLMDVSMAPPGKPESRGILTYPLYALLRDRTGAAFEAIGVYDGGRAVNLAGDAAGPAERLDGHRITATGLAALGTRPLYGRLPVAADEAVDAKPSMVLSYPLWQRHFAGRADVVGQTANVDGQPTVILGVMPEGFGLLDNSSDVWLTSSLEWPAAQQFQHALRGVGRLKPGVSMAQAQAAVKVAVDEYARTFPNRDKGWTVEVTPWMQARFGGLRPPLIYVQLAVSVMLLLLCVSVAALSGGSTFAQILTLSVCAGGVAAAAIWLGLPFLLALAPNALPRLSEVGFHIPEFVFTLVLSVVAGLIIAVMPGGRLSRRNESGQLGGPVGGGWLGTAVLVVLLAVQMALAFALLAGTGLAMRAIGDLKSRDVGVNPSGLLSADVYLPRSPYVTLIPAEPGTVELAKFNPEGPAVYDRVRAALQAMPGAVQAAGVGTHPFASNPFVQCFVGDAEHTPDNQIAAQYLAVTENYYNTMGIRIVKGRDFSADDRADSPWVILVNETLARQQWPGGDPIGQKLTLTFQPNDEEPKREIVGVVADTIPFRGASEVPPLIYVLHRQQAAQQRSTLEARRTVMSFVVRTNGDPLALSDAVRDAVAKIDPTSAVASIRTVQSYLDAGQTVLFQFIAALLGIFALVAVVMSAVGTSALALFNVAHGRGVIASMLGALMAVAVGGAAGLYAWRQLASTIASFLTNLRVTPSDPQPLIVTGVVLLVTALVACLMPSLRRRATR